MPFFSVIIPTYNRAHTLTDTIESILRQTHSDFEIIIVDDGSMDDTAQLIKSRYDNNEKVKYFFKENEERGAARNFGMKWAKGVYAVIFDSDDWMHAEHLEVIEKKIKKLGPEHINFIASKYQLKDNRGSVKPGSSAPYNEGWYNYVSLLKGNFLGCMYTVKLSNPQLRLFLNDRKFATQEDWLFILDNLRNDSLYLIDKITITVRHDENRSTANNQRVIEARKLASEWALENLNLSEAERRTIMAWTHYYCGIHQYLDQKRSAALQEVLTAIKTAGINKKFLLLLMKSMIGRKLITSIQ